VLSWQLSPSDLAAIVEIMKRDGPTHVANVCQSDPSGAFAQVLHFFRRPIFDHHVRLTGEQVETDGLARLTVSQEIWESLQENCVGHYEFVIDEDWLPNLAFEEQADSVWFILRWSQQ